MMILDSASNAPNPPPPRQRGMLDSAFEAVADESSSAGAGADGEESQPH